MFRKPSSIETVDDCFNDGSKRCIYDPHAQAVNDQARDRLKRLKEEEAQAQAPCKAPRALLQQSAEVVIQDMIDTGKTEPLIAALVAKGKAETVVKRIIEHNPTAVRQVVKGLMSTRRGVLAIPKVRKPEVQEVMVVQFVDDQGETNDAPRYVWLNKHSWLQSMLDLDRYIDETPRGTLGGWTRKWTKEGDALEWVTGVLSELEFDAPQCVYLDADFFELTDWGSDDEDVERDEHGMTEYDRFMDDNSYWNQNHYEEYAPRFVDKIHNEVLEDLMTPEQVEEEFTLKNVSLHIVGTLTINPDCY